MRRHTVLDRWRAHRRAGSGRAVFALLVMVIVAVAVVAPVTGPEAVSPAASVVPLVIGTLSLRLRRMRALIGVAVVGIAYDLAVIHPRGAPVGAAVVVGVVAFVADRVVRTREHLGVPGLRGESMLAELRDRLQTQGDLPALPAGWHAEHMLSSAGGTSFGGDFLVSWTDGGVLELALVDVSGKGVDAGTRALLLSGALGGLLGSIRPTGFLAAANQFLLRQDWPEGFATAVHLTVELSSGDFRLDAAGHPPAATFDAGSGAWRLLESGGPALGLLRAADFPVVTGRLGPGDALLLYTDGLVEVSGRDLEVGIDKLLGEANRLVVGGFAGGARLLMETVAPHAADDRALVLLWRS